MRAVRRRSPARAHLERLDALLQRGEVRLDVLDGAFAANLQGEAGHLCVLASRVVFRAITGRADQPRASLAQVLDETSACKITLDVRLEKVTALDKVRADALRLKIRSGQTFEITEVHARDQAFNRILALAPQKWH